MKYYLLLLGLIIVALIIDAISMIFSFGFKEYIEYLKGKRKF